MNKLSIIIPTLNEQQNEFLAKSLNTFSKFKDLEVIISDGGSEDDTLTICKAYKTIIINDKINSRAQRINVAVDKASSPMILLYHPRSYIDEDGIQYLIDNHERLTWGGFSHNFDDSHPILKFTSWYSNNVRARLMGILYLDHCIFLKKYMLNDVFPIPNVDIFEDTILSHRLRKFYGRPSVLKVDVVTSSIRFKANGIFRQGISNQILKLLFHLGYDHKKMNQHYEKKTQLNSKYPSKKE